MEKVKRTPASLKKMVETFGMEILHRGSDYDSAVITISDVNRPALQLVGFYDYFDDKRLQILGRGEIRYLERMTEAERLRVFNQLMSYPFPAMIVARNMEAPPELVQMADKHDRTLLRAVDSTVDITSRLIDYLNRVTAPQITRHGVSLMNGVDSEEIIAAKIGAEHVLPSLIKVASHKEADGYHFNPETTIGIIYGELAAPLKSERVQAVEALLAGTGIHSRVTPYIKEEIWSKFRLNVCNNLPQAILGAGVGCYQSSAHMKAISEGLCHELEAIAVAKGIDLSKVDASSRHGSLVPPATRYSTLQDLDAGRHTEIDMFSGALMRMGQELGIPTPYNEYTYHMIKALEEKNDGLFDYAAKASNLTCAK